MALHTEIPIHRTGIRLLDLAIKAQVQMPRTVKRGLGEKITQHCVDMLDLMALANATQHETRAKYIHKLLATERAITVLLRVSHDARYISPKLWAESIGKHFGFHIQELPFEKFPPEQEPDDGPASDVAAAADGLTQTAVEA